MENKYGLEYSVEQKAFNIERLDLILMSNLNMIKRKVSNDYKIVFIGDYDDCELFIKQFEEVWDGE